MRKKGGEAHRGWGWGTGPGRKGTLGAALGYCPLCRLDNNVGLVTQAFGSLAYCSFSKPEKRPISHRPLRDRLPAG
jgi:hypothetical protein